MHVTLRAVILGLALLPATCLWVVETELIWYSGQPTTVSLFTHVVFILFWLTAGNALLKRCRPAWAMAQSELLVIYTILSLGSAMCSHDMIEPLVQTIGHGHRYAQVQHMYGDVLRHVPVWLTVQDPAALEAYYMGQESIFTPANFRPWLEPLLWWGLFLLAMMSVMWGLLLLLRKQWTENEKLSYPILQVPMQLTSESRALFQSKLFWGAFGLAASIGLMNGLNVLYPIIPAIPIVHVVNLRTFFPEPPWNAMGDAWVSFYPFAIGMCFFMPLDLAFSCWFFFLVWAFLRVLAVRMGMHGMAGFPFVTEQSAGAYYALAVAALWISRGQLSRTGRILLGREPDGVSPWERREAWTAVFLLTAGGGFIAWFCMAASMTTWVAVLFFVLYMLMSIAITRMRAELGPPSHDLPWAGPHYQILKSRGAAAMAKANPADLIMFIFFNSFARNFRSHPMPHGMEGFRIAERLRLSNGRYLIAMLLALAVGIVCGFGAMLWAMNHYGASAQAEMGEVFAQGVWGHANTWFTAPEPRVPEAGFAVGVGFLVCLGLMALRMTFAWWPLHPVGYAICGGWSIAQLWSSILIAWCVKALIMRYGGARLYRPASIFFAGLILGDLIMGGFWSLYGVLMGVKVYHFWPY